MTATLLAALLLAAPAPACEAPVRVYDGGHLVGRRCPGELAGRTILDLGDDWVPYPFAGVTADGVTPAYRDTLVALAAMRWSGDPLAAEDRYLELYGVTPSPRVVLAAMDDEARHACHDAVDDAALRVVGVPLRFEDRAQARARREAQAAREARLAAAIAAAGVADADALLAVRPRQARLVAATAAGRRLQAAIAAVHGHLACEGLLAPGHAAFDAATRQALAVYQRRHWIVARGEFDADTREAMVRGSRELDLRLALRLLRQRVADAAGLIEDGSARAEWGSVLGRQLDPAELRYQGGYPPLADGAPDLVAAATEAAARALGWLDFAGARAGLRGLLEEDARVAVVLPPAPAYHHADMRLRAVIDRRSAADRAVLTLFARDGDRDVALVRWPTTVGGRKAEKLASGAVVERDKPSDVGPRVWRDLVVAPVWYAPDSTPDAELVGVRAGRRTVKEDLIGPGYRSAYGLVMLIHHQPVAGRTRTHWLDHGIRTHGSVSYRSILSGDSHGCHRLYNHQALRLATFLLRHVDHVAHGPVLEPYGRRVRSRGRVWYVRRDERGFRYELTPPVAVDVLPGVLRR
ncbi:MAG: hypothetical protein JNL82_40630 [Myxococcales bacterium]|nr:hypothetical protein [Myxococcales bacterium]